MVGIINTKPFGKFTKNLPNFPAYSESKQTEGINKPVTEQPPKPPLQCWFCGKSYYYKNFPHKVRTEQLSNMQEASTVGDIARSMPITNATLDDH